jgi:hypothetical protein
MNKRRMMAVLFAVLALTALVGAANASAAKWFINGSELTSPATETVSAEKAAGETKLELTAAALGFKLTATGISCVGCTIDNTVEGGHSAGKLKFTGVTVDEPLGCVVASSLETGALTDRVKMGVAGHESETFDEFFTDPIEGAAQPFITIKITECAAAGSYKVSGTVTGHSANATGVEATTQTLRFSEADQANGGGALTMGGKTAQLMGEVTNKLSGANAGKTWSAK